MRMYYKIWCWPSRLWFFFYLSITNYIAFCQGRRLRVAAHLTLYFSVDLLKRPSKGIIKVWVPLLAFEKLMLPNTIRFLLLCSSSKSARRKATEKFARELEIKIGWREKIHSSNDTTKDFLQMSSFTSHNTFNFYRTPSTCQALC